MNINIARNSGIVKALLKIAQAIERSNELKELELQNIHRLTTRTEPAKKTDLEDTRVSYTDARYEELVGQFERQAGRPLSDEEAGRILAVLASDVDES